MGSQLSKMSYGSEHIVIPRPLSHQDAVKAAHKHFPHLDKDRIAFQTDKLRVCEKGQYVRISEAAWFAAIQQLDGFEVIELPLSGSTSVAVTDESAPAYTKKA